MRKYIRYCKTKLFETSKILLKKKQTTTTTTTTKPTSFEKKKKLKLSSATKHKNRNAGIQFI